MTSKNKPTIIIDSREKTPWNFDNDEKFGGVMVAKLDAGDYSLDGLENIISIERKADVNELLSNFYFQKKRLIAEMERLRSVDHVFFIIEQELSDILNPNSYFVNTARKNKRGPYVPVGVVMSNLLDLMYDYGIHVIFAGTRAKDITRSLLLTAYKKYG